jgi:flavin reductase (DIM6/NTAB) family NADH-FMN oxidoreductase RutF
MTVASAGFRSLMAVFPTGVAVVTTLDVDDTPWGMTCSSVCSVSVEPPTLLVCVRDGSPTLAAMLRRGSFAVNLLHHGARPVAELFASGDPDRFDRVHWETAFGGPHLVRDAHAVADCRITRRHQVGTHVVVFGEVVDVTHRPGEHPLLYGMRQYAAWPEA